MSDLLTYMRRHEHELVTLIKAITEFETPTAHTAAEKNACDRLATYLVDLLTDLGADVERIPQDIRGDHLIARWGHAHRPTLLLTHYDTVWPLGTLASMPIHSVDGRLHGPGIFDMKGGLALGLFAIRALREQNRLHSPVTLLINSDEEIGSLTSRPLIENEARRSRAALVLEPAQPPNAALKTSRKGVGRFHLKIIGKPGHSGWVAETGASAIEELARQIIDLYNLADPALGATINVGVIRGGTRANVIAAEAEAHIDVRVMTKTEGDRITRAILDRHPYNPNTRLEITGNLNRPPMERTPGTLALFSLAQQIGAQLGLTVSESSSGGGSDGNFTSAIGVPTLDGLGVVGAGAHAHDEHLILSQLAPRAALLAGILEAVTTGQAGLP